MERTPTTTDRRTRSGLHRGVAVPMVLALLGSVLLFSSLAGADTTSTHTTVAHVGAGADVASGGTLTNLADGDVVTVRVTQASSADPITGITRIAQCEGGIDIPDDASLDPTVTGLCLDDPLSPGTNNFVQDKVKASLSDDFIEATFIVGEGDASVQYDDGELHTNEFSCDADSDCSLWVQIARTGGSDFVHFDLDFGAAGGTTTSTTAGATTTSTTTGGATTTSTTTGGATTTSTTTGGATTTSTTTGGATTSSTVTTTTTLPAGTTVTPSIAVGGTINVSSTGWEPESEVAATLFSDPVELGTLTADATGKITGALVVPASVPAGAHQLVLSGFDATGDEREVTAAVTITAAPGATTTTTTSGGLPRTGANVFKVLISGLMLAYGGWLFAVSAIRRRERLGLR